MPINRTTGACGYSKAAQRWRAFFSLLSMEGDMLVHVPDSSSSLADAFMAKKILSVSCIFSHWQQKWAEPLTD